jgi:hypothetical protein
MTILASSVSHATQTHRAPELDSAVIATTPWIKIILASEDLVGQKSLTPANRWQILERPTLLFSEHVDLR